MKKIPCVYILANRKKGALYIGVTSNLGRRLEAHCSGAIKGFTSKYGIHRLVYAEFHDEMILAIEREKQLKKWNRAWKIELIEKENPGWCDLSNGL